MDIALMDRDVSSSMIKRKPKKKCHVLLRLLKNSLSFLLLTRLFLVIKKLVRNNQYSIVKYLFTTSTCHSKSTKRSSMFSTKRQLSQKTKSSLTIFLLLLSNTWTSTLNQLTAWVASATSLNLVTITRTSICTCMEMHRHMKT